MHGELAPVLGAQSLLLLLNRLEQVEQRRIRIVFAMTVFQIDRFAEVIGHPAHDALIVVFAPNAARR